MTKQEHLLMMTMFTRQSQMLEILHTVMKREDLLKGDDLQAFISVIANDDPLNTEIAQSVSSEYKTLAKHFNIVLDFD